MQKEIYAYIVQNPALHEFMRMHPIWYRKLRRDPQSFTEFQYEAKKFFGETLPQRMEKVQQSLQLAMMLMQMLQINEWMDKAE